jgi:hypothetical protein
MQKISRAALATASLATILSLTSCDPQDILGDCRIVTDNFAGSYGPNEQKEHTFQVACAGTISLFWTCPQCPDPDAGRLILLDPVGNQVLQLMGAGFRGRTQNVPTILEGTWTLLIEGTGGGFVNNYGVDVSYPAR